MTYTEALDAFNEVNLRDRVKEKFESVCRPSLLEEVKEMDNISEPASLIRFILRLTDAGFSTDEYVYWQKVFLYFITPECSRKRNF